MDHAVVDALILARAWLTELCDFESGLYEAIDQALLSGDADQLQNAYVRLQQRAG